MSTRLCLFCRRQAGDDAVCAECRKALTTERLAGVKAAWAVAQHLVELPATKPGDRLLITAQTSERHPMRHLVPTAKWTVQTVTGLVLAVMAAVALHVFEVPWEPPQFVADVVAMLVAACFAWFKRETNPSPSGLAAAELELGRRRWRETHGR